MSNIHGLGSSAQRNASNNGGGPGGFGGFGMGGSSSGQPLSCKDKMKNVWNAIPMWNKFVLTTCSLIYLLSWITNAVVMYTILIPAFMLKFQGKFILVSLPFIQYSLEINYWTFLPQQYYQFTVLSDQLRTIRYD